MSDLSLSQGHPADSPVSSTQDIGPDSNSIQLSGRRGSQFSASSYTRSAANQQHRASLSSFASSSGSPLVNAASSNGTTIGDLSMASMPLLPGVHSVRDGDGARRVNSSSASISISDSSSIHSYPPKPRNSVHGSIEGSASGAAKNRRDYVETDIKVFLDLQAGHSPATRVVASAAGLLNPFAPLRKRLVRTLSSGKRIGVEIQLIVELLDAVDHYMSLFAANLSPEELSNGTDARLEIVNEVTSLLRELTEIAPEAQRCLAQGNYGPLCGAPGGGRRQSNHRSNDMFDSGLATWWPRRLVKDCRGLLDEVGFSPGNSTPRRTKSLLTTTVGTSRPSDGPSDADVGPEVEQDNPPEIVLATVLANLSRDLGSRVAKEPEIPPDLVAIEARREELLNEGRRRWQAYVKRTQRED
ncbi:hypothetical protein P7C70_g6565, partial [Phenoliferia sp. Uapishka_3]